jgi:long-chain acyl-CoA synthetase
MASALDAEHRTVYNMLARAAETWGSAPALHQPNGDGTYRTYSWLDYKRIAGEIACGLRTLGIGHGAIVGVASETRAEFYLADIGVMTCGCTAAAVYTSLAPRDQAKTLRACDPQALFFESAKMMRVLDAAGTRDLEVPRILLTGEAEDALSFERLREIGREAAAREPDLLERITAEVRPSDPCILYLTSGATGEPKMGLVSHNSVVANCDLGPKVVDIGENDVTLAFLPSAHITQRLAMELLAIRMGVPVHFSEGLSKMPTELRTIRPTFFVAPPRVWERAYLSIATEIRKKPAAVRKLFYLGLGVGSEMNRARQQGREPGAVVKSSMKFFDRLVFSKIRARLGGRLRIAVSGAAPLGRDLAEFYASIGLPLIEGYGLTEGGIVALNPPGRPMPGSIGRALPGVEMKLADDGELLIRSETLFSGYYKDPEATAAVLRDGWLHTGDLAEIDGRGFIWITGRKKELIVSSNGKKIYPAKIESLFKLEPVVNQVLLVGDRLPYMAALITLNPQALEGLKEPAEVEVKRVIQRVNKQLAPFERIRRFKILDRDFSLENGELTPTFKLRRGRVLENFKQEIAELYAGREELLA